MGAIGNYEIVEDEFRPYDTSHGTDAQVSQVFDAPENKVILSVNCYRRVWSVSTSAYRDRSIIEESDFLIKLDSSGASVTLVVDNNYDSNNNHPAYFVVQLVVAEMGC